MFVCISKEWLLTVDSSVIHLNIFVTAIYTFCLLYNNDKYPDYYSPTTSSRVANMFPNHMISSDTESQLGEMT